MKYIEYKKELLGKLFKGENIKLRNKGKKYVRLIYFRNELENLVIEIGISMEVIENGDYDGINTMLEEIRTQWLNEWINKKVVNLNGYELISLYGGLNDDYKYREDDNLIVGKINKVIDEIHTKAKIEKLTTKKYYDKYSAHNLLKSRGWDI